MAKKKIRGNLGVLLTLLGTLYGRPDNAIKEYTSNALDEWIKAKEKGEMEGACEVGYLLEKERITINYNSPGMDEREFDDALNRVADSIKRESTIRQIGKLGIGIFAFNQVGSTCTFYSKKAKGTPTIKVVLISNSDGYDIDTAIKRESRLNPGMTIVITRLHHDPTKPRGPLAPGSLQRFFAEQFDSDLREGNLKVSINCDDKIYEVEPPEINLPRVGETFFREVPLSTDRQKKFNCQFWFDPSGKSHVSIRHMRVPIIKDLKNYSAYGLEESIYASSSLKGYIDADFLKPLPSRTSFEENQDWVQFLVELNERRPSLEAEIEELRREEEEKRLTEVQKRAIELARDILNTEEFKDLDLLKGLGRKPPEPRLPPNGFDFVPSSIRIEPRKTGTLPLKAFVPRAVPDNSLVKLSISDSSSVELKAKSLFLRASEADEDGVVTVHVSFEGKLNTTVPAILTAITGKLKAEAHIRVAKPQQTRGPIIIGKEKEGRGISYTEDYFENGPRLHSEFVAGIVRVNKLNPDFIRQKEGSEQQKIGYGALMIGKEAIAHSDGSGVSENFLERLLSYLFQVQVKARQSPLKMKRLRKD